MKKAIIPASGGLRPLSKRATARSLAVPLLAFAFVACTSVKTVVCTVVGGVDQTIANAVAAAGQCTNPSAIDADLQAEASKLGLCTQSGKQAAGPVATVCAELASAYIGTLGTKINPAYGCNPTIAISTLQAAATAACDLIPTAQKPEKSAPAPVPAPNQAKMQTHPGSKVVFPPAKSVQGAH